MNSGHFQHQTAISKKLISYPFLIIIMMAFVLASCGDSSSPIYGDDDDNDDSPGPGEVWMVGQSFTPPTLEVQAGTVVTWTNKSDLVHTVTSGTPDNPDGMFDSGDIEPGETYTYTFNNPGTYDYFCIPHQPSMTGRVIVGASDDDDGDDDGY